MIKFKVFLILILLICTVPVWSADTLKIHLTYKHILNDAGQTRGYKTLVQQFYTPEGQLFREINYNESDGQINNYVFIFYRDGLVYTRECHSSNDSILYIMKYEYDAGGNEISVSKLVPGADRELISTERWIKNYDSDKRIISSKKYYGRKTGMIKSFTYNSRGLLFREKTVYKKSAMAAVRSEIRDYAYTDEGSLSEIIISGKDADGKLYNLKEKFDYNESGLLTSVKHFGNDGTLTIEKSYGYLNSGVPSKYEEFDSTGKKTLLLQYDYKKHYMEKGTQVSYYEDL